MGYMSEDGRHEGWDSAEFPDGWLSVGADPDGVLTVAPASIARGSDTAVNVVDGRTAIGWRGVCTCGWLGPLYRRVPSPGQHDVARHQVHADPGPGAVVPAGLEDAIYVEWRDHLPHETLAEVTAAAEDARKAEARLDGAVAAARGAGQTWEAIGRAAGMTRQSANQRWRPR